MQGADLEALSRLRAKLDAKADQLSAVTTRATSDVAMMDRLWEGPDSAAFRHEWNTRHRPLLIRAAQSLREVAETVERNRQAQELASAVASLGGPGSIGGSGPSAVAAQSLKDVQATLDAGDDLAVTEGELNSIQEQLAELSDEDLEHVLGGLTDRQLEVLFHNVHSSGFWSNDWNDSQRAAFYENLNRIGETGDLDVWRRLGEFSPRIDPDPTLGLPDTARDEADQPKLDYWDSLEYDYRNKPLWGSGSNPVDFTQVRQGKIGDCYLISAMISLAMEDPGVIDDLITENANGSYTVHFADGTREVVSPDLVYATDGTSPFATSEDGAAWPAVIEKAYAQKFGGFGDDPGITGGQSSVAIEALTGRDSSYIKAGDLTMDDLVQRFDSGEILGLSTIDKPDDMSTAEWTALDTTPDAFKGPDAYQRLHQNHAFIVVDVDETSGTVSVINPWDPSKPPFEMPFEDMQEAVNGVRVNAAP